MKEAFVRPTWIYVGALLLLGLIGYLATGMQSITALIPAFFGIVVIIVMLLFARLARPSMSAWILLILAVVGLLATIGGIPKVVGLLMGQETARPAAVISQSIMALVSLVFGVVMLTIARGSRKSV